MNFKTLLTALAVALLVISMVGCGQTNELKSIQLSTSNTSESNTSGLTLPAMSYQLQMYTWGNYSDGKQKLLNSVGDVSYQIVLDPVYNTDAYGHTLPQASDVLTLSPTGLITSAGIAACSWVDTAEVTPTTPAPVYAWAVSGQYDLTATYAGMTTPPVAIALSDTGGDAEFPPGDSSNVNNPLGECGPSASQ